MKKEFPRCVFYITLLVLLLGLSGIISIAVCGKFALVWKQSIRLVCGVLLMWAAAMIPFEKFKRCVPYLAAAALAVLVVLLRYDRKGRVRPNTVIRVGERFLGMKIPQTMEYWEEEQEALLPEEPLPEESLQEETEPAPQDE